jgi:hypothetical protein
MANMADVISGYGLDGHVLGCWTADSFLATTYLLTTEKLIINAIPWLSTMNS